MIAALQIQRLDALRGKVSAFQEMIDAETRDLENIRDSKSLEVQALDLSSRALEVYRGCIDYVSTKGVAELEGLLTEGLRYIFYDRDYRVRIDLSDKRNKKEMDIFLIETRDGEDLELDVRSDTGGSISTIVSVLTQIFYVNKFDCENILFLDECFRDVDSRYYKNLFELLDKFVAKGMKILLISHDPNIHAYANTVYEATGEGFKCVHGGSR